MRNLLVLALALSVTLTADDVLELGYDVTDEDFKAYFEIPEDAETHAGYKRHEDFNPESLKAFMSAEEIAQQFPATEAAPANVTVTDETAAPAAKPETAAAKKKREKAEALAAANAGGDASATTETPAPAAPKKPGVIQSILDIITKATAPVSEAKILEEMVLLFPERESAAMAKTIKAQLGGKAQPLRMEEEKGVKFVLTLTEAKEGEKQQRLYAIAK